MKSIAIVRELSSSSFGVTILSFSFSCPMIGRLVSRLLVSTIEMSPVSAFLNISSYMFTDANWSFKSITAPLAA